MEHQHQQKYTCPTHPEIIQDKEGNCPICGMTLIPVNDNVGPNNPNHHHDNQASMGHAGHDHEGMIADFKKRFYFVLALTVPIMLLRK